MIGPTGKVEVAVFAGTILPYHTLSCRCIGEERSCGHEQLDAFERKEVIRYLG
jgi:hypothetical protein